MNQGRAARLLKRGRGIYRKAGMIELFYGEKGCIRVFSENLFESMLGGYDGIRKMTCLMGGHARCGVGSAQTKIQLGANLQKPAPWGWR